MKTWLYSILALCGLLLFCYVAIQYLLPFIGPFILAAILAQLIEPLVTRLEFRGRVPRGLAVTIVLSVFTGLFTLLAVVGITRLVHEVRNLVVGAPAYYALGVDLSNQFAEQLAAFHNSLPESMKGILQELLQNAQNMVSKAVPTMVSALSNLGGLPMLLANLAIALVATFFLSRDRQMIHRFLYGLLPKDWQPKVRQVNLEVWASAMRFAKAQMILILLTAIQSIAGLAIIDANYPVTIGLLVGLADVMPLLGPAAVFVPWIAFHFLLGSKAFGLKLLILYVIVAGVRQLLEAKVVGESIGLHPLATLFAVFLGFQFFGAIGFVIGPLLAIFLKAVIKSGLLPIFQEEQISA